MSINGRYCPVVSMYYYVIMNIDTSNMHNVTWCYFNYLEYLSLYVFICTRMSVYTQHYGGRHA